MRLGTGLALAATIAVLAPSAGAAESGALLGGTITNAVGEPLAGVTVSAKPDGGSITTSVFTDANGRYVFPPLPPGHYALAAQARGFTSAHGALALAARQEWDGHLRPAKDPGRSLTGDELVASLPDATPEDYRLKQIVRTACVGCHTPSFTLQHRFDEAGWTKVLELMKRINIFGVYQGPNAKPNQIIDANEKELAAYLARARGPNSTAPAKLRPRPSGEAARVVFKEYDVPVDPDLGLPEKYAAGNGSTWTDGAPGSLEAGRHLHDAWADLDGNLWFTNNSPSHDLTVGRIDARTGAAKFFKVEAANGLAANAHGMTRDPNGIIWFNVGLRQGHGGLGRLDPRTGKIEVFDPPFGAGVGGAVTIDWDPKGGIWMSAPAGALRFDPATRSFTQFTSPVPKGQGPGLTYGTAADSDGNGWWAQMAIDIVNRGDAKTGQASDIKLPPLQDVKARFTPAQQQFYAAATWTDFNGTWPWGQGPRRMGSDKNGHVLYVCDSWGGNLARIDTHTMQLSFIRVPGTAYPYHATVDQHHDVWVNDMDSDQVRRYDPKTGSWAAFDLPSIGTETRYVSLLERKGAGMEVVIPEYRTMRIAVMTFRSAQQVARAEAAFASEHAER